MQRWTLTALVLFVAGCSFNVSNSPKYPTDYVIGGTYRVKQRLSATTSDRPGKAVYDYVFLKVPKQSWELSGKDQGFVSFIPVGTHLIIDRLDYRWHPENGDMLQVLAKFVDGPIRAKEVHLYFISKLVKAPRPPGKWEPEVPCVDPAVLELVTPTGSASQTAAAKTNRPEAKEAERAFWGK